MQDDFEQRFGGVGRLYGASGLARLRRARVCVVGIGGVGSWVVEALARSGVGALTLVDLDDVCVTNVNRQLHALDGEIGRPKVEVMQRRVAAIHPGCRVTCRVEFFTAETAAALLEPRFDAVVDAIDVVSNKCLLIAAAVAAGGLVVTTGGAGGRRDPSQIRVADLSRSTHDGLLAEVRRRLRRDHRFPGEAGAEFGVPCVYSLEPVRDPEGEEPGCGVGVERGPVRLGCEGGYGSVSHVTGAFGLAAASVVVGRLAGG